MVHGAIQLDEVVEGMQVAGRVLGIASRHRQFVQSPGLSYALVDAPCVNVAHPQAGGGVGVALSRTGARRQDRC